ncbi:MAG: T9SS type A sorting domain-containing protein [Chlorobiota bacterium]|nr:T9SS type A sorting domain-containing protein [Chlorobiota bacterium]QQS65632.1 MAG: T9SS type A sorting domain-containing protein [Chlorobiota bacterium]
MRKLLLIAVIGLISTRVFAQVEYYQMPFLNAGTNPGGLNNESENPYSAQTPIAGWTVVLDGANGDPVWSPEQTLPISFKFNGEVVNKYKVSSNGVVTFSTSTTVAPPVENTTLPSASIPDKSVCVWGISQSREAVSGTTTYASTILKRTFGSSPRRQHWVYFNFFTDDNIPEGWTYWAIVFEETTNKIYIVDVKTLCVTGGALCSENCQITAGVQFDSKRALMVDGSPKLGSRANKTNDFTPGDNSYWMFAPGVQPDYDMSGISVKMKPVLFVTDKETPVIGYFRNLGAKPVTEVELSYAIDGGAPISKIIGGLNIAPMEFATLTHPTNFAITGSGSKDIEVWVSKINGSSDGNPGDDKASLTLNIKEMPPERKILHEVFTSSTCPPCNPGNANLKNVLNDHSDREFTVVKYQQDFPGTGDPYCTSETVARRNYYKVNAIPNMQVNGGWNGNAQSYTEDLFQQFSEGENTLKLNANFSMVGNKVHVDVDMTPLQDLTGTHTLQVLICEKLTTKNVKTNGEVEFEDVVKKMLPDQNGTAFTGLTKGTKVTKSFDYEFKGSYRLSKDGASANRIKLATEHSVENFENLEVVAFLQNKTTNEVIQSNWGVKVPPAGINDNTVENQFNLFPNPVTDALNIEFYSNTNKRAEFSMFNVNGEKVSEGLLNTNVGPNKANISTDGFSSGNYTISLKVGDKTFTKQIVVVK